MYLAGVFVAFEKHDQREKEKEKNLFFCISVGLKKPKKYSLMRWRVTVCCLCNTNPSVTFCGCKNDVYWAWLGQSYFL